MMMIPLKQLAMYGVPIVMGLALFSCLTRPMPPGPLDATFQADVNDRLGKVLAQARNDGETDINFYVNEDPDLVQAGDFVEIDYTMTLENGDLIRTTREGESEKLRQDSQAWIDPESVKDMIFCPEPIIVGKGDSLADVSDQLIGMKIGDKKRLTLPSDHGGIPLDQEKIKRFARTRQSPVAMTTSQADFLKQFGRKPEIGISVQATPYFLYKITNIENGLVSLGTDFSGEKVVQDDLGHTRLKREDDHVTLELEPDIGAPFKLGSKKGHIVSLDDTHFTVDFNPPLAGKTLFMDLELVSLVKASRFWSVAIDWLENYDEGLAAMAGQGKPMLLFLYRTGCPWCERMEKEVFTDPRIRMIGKDLTWVQVNSSIHTDIKAMYNQDGFPLIVLMNADQSIYRALKGYRDAGKLRKEIRLWMNDTRAGTWVYPQDDEPAASDSCHE
ncbi:MAG: thioredoxin family protein [Proteobacteria bacterium]|nr:thioredoxin family protein [Pseudomonadota bacterium]